MTEQAETRPLSTAQKQGIFAAIACTGIIALSWGLSAPLIAQHLERMTGSGVQLGLLISLSAVATMLSTPFVPKLLSKYNSRTVLILCMVIGTASIPLLKVFMTPAAWFILKFIGSCAFTIVFVVAEIWINQLTPEHLRGRIMGLYGAALAGGMGIGSALAVLTGIDGWAPFLICAAINFSAVLPVLMLQNAEHVDAPPEEDARLSTIFKIMLAAPAIMMCGIVFGAIEQSIVYFLPVYDTRLGHTEDMARKLLLVAAVGNALLQLPMGMLADKVNRDKLAIALMSVAFLGPLAMALAGANFTALAVLGFFYVGLTTALYTVGLVQLGERFKGHKLAAANAGFIIAYGVGSLIVPPLAGKMMDIYDPLGFMWTMSALGVLGLAVVMLRRMRFNR